MVRTLPILALVLILTGGCQSSSEGAWGYPAEGYVLPTVAGRTPTQYSCLEEANKAFTRSAGSVSATLQDAAWLRFMGNPDEVERTYRAYFECGYTSFLVDLRSDAYTQPTKEDFVLTDNTGKQVRGSPIRYEGSPVLVDDRYFSSFEISFQHVITADLQWLRLTRVCDGSVVEWRFAACPPPAPAPACPPPVAPGIR